MPVENNPVPGTVRTDAGALGGTVSLSEEQSFTQTAATLPDAPITTTKPAVVPAQGFRLNSPAAASGGDPFLGERSFRADGAAVRVRTGIDGDGQQDADISNVRVTGQINDDTQYQVSVGSNQVVSGGVAYVDPNNPRTSLSAGVSVDTKPNALNAARFNANAVLTPQGSPVGVYGSVSTNDIDPNSPASTTTEVGLQIQPDADRAGRDPALGATGITVGYRNTDARNAAGATTETEAGFVRLTGVPLGISSLTADSEVSVDDKGQTGILGVNYAINPNNAVRVEGQFRRTNDGPDSGAAAVMFRSSF